MNTKNKWVYTEEAYLGNINGFEIAMIYFQSGKHTSFYLSWNVSPKKITNDQYLPLSKELYEYGAHYEAGKISIHLLKELKDEEALRKAFSKVEPLTKLLLERGFTPSETKEDYSRLKRIDLRKR